VHSVHRAAVYVETEPSGGLLTLAVDDVGGVPGGILVAGATDLHRLGLARGMRLEPSPDGMRIPAAGVTIRTSAAHVWSPALPPSARLTTSTSHWGNAAGSAGPARALAAGRAPAAGLGPMLREGDSAPAGDARADDPWLVAARVRIERQRWALGAGDLASILGEAIELIGLGPGLTPSGDDYLVGLLAGLEATGHRSRPALANAIAHAAPTRTTAVGAATLAHAARGAYAERLHDVLRAVATGSGDALTTAIGRAMAYGATSGADTLVGLFTALEVSLAERAHGSVAAA
jgi:hypothetical protein